MEKNYLWNINVSLYFTIKKKIWFPRLEYYLLI